MTNAVINNIETFQNAMLKYDFALQMLETQLKILIKEYELEHQTNPVEHIKSRTKKLDSAISKLERKGLDINLDNLQKHVHDMIGIRIVCSFLSDIYEVVKMIEKSEYIRVIEKKDYITNPKKSGYTSYHLIVRIPVYLSEGIEEVEAEIQIRTIAMDFWASLEHKIQYKFAKHIPEQIKEELYNCAVDIKNLDHKMLMLNDIVNYYKKNVEE